MTSCSGPGGGGTALSSPLACLIAMSSLKRAYKRDSLIGPSTGWVTRAFSPGGGRPNQSAA
eukprot:10792053-Alexandrium_andersonii.AAC.1